MSTNANYVGFAHSESVAIIGLGYVGLPLALRMSSKFQTIGFDINESRIDELQLGVDTTLEVSENELKSALNLKLTSSIGDCARATCYVVTVPTPVDSDHRPDLTALSSACRLVAGVLKCGDIVIFESTVFPGCTEEVCVPLLEQFSGLQFNQDFFCGYSPERINPGDKLRTIEKIIKVTSGSTDQVAKIVDSIYSAIIPAGTHLARSIKVAEAAKVIENTQRDLNIALMNELSLIFQKLDIDTQEVLAAASTKWNFLPFSPGLVGGHCIGVDPYYLTYKAEAVGYSPKVILAGRAINDQMPKYVAEELINHLEERDFKLNDSTVLILGATFKENCPDIRNTKVLPIAEQLQKAGMSVNIFDPWVDQHQIPGNFVGNFLSQLDEYEKYSVILLAVPHTTFIEKGADYYKAMLVKDGVFADIKGAFSIDDSHFRL